MNFVECDIDSVILRVYMCGKIERYVKKYNDWREFGSVNKGWYGYNTARITVNKKIYVLARIMYHAYCREEFDIDDNLQHIDHINHNTLDNRIENLRVVSNQQNQQNRANIKGYYWHRQFKKWHARITDVNKKRISLGYFDKEEEAEQAYLNAKPLYHII